MHFKLNAMKKPIQEVRNKSYFKAMFIIIKTKSKLYSYNYNFRLKTISIIKFEKKMLTEENDVHLAAPLVSMTNKQTNNLHSIRCYYSPQQSIFLKFMFQINCLKLGVVYKLILLFFTLQNLILYNTKNVLKLYVVELCFFYFFISKNLSWSFGINKNIPVLNLSTDNTKVNKTIFY